MDLATRIRTELADGKPPEHIVAELVASGMSHPTAQRLVDRAVATPAPPTATQTEDDEAKDDPGGKWALVRREPDTSAIRRAPVAIQTTSC